MEDKEYLISKDKLKAYVLPTKLIEKYGIKALSANEFNQVEDEDRMKANIIAKFDEKVEATHKYDIKHIYELLSSLKRIKIEDNVVEIAFVNGNEGVMRIKAIADGQEVIYYVASRV